VRGTPAEVTYSSNDGLWACHIPEEVYFQFFVFSNLWSG
jgi:hypothetical protein